VEWRARKGKNMERETKRNERGQGERGVMRRREQCTEELGGERVD